MNIETQDITESKKVIEVTMTRHTIDTRKCRECRRADIVPDTDGVVPESGGYGPGIITDIVAAYEKAACQKNIRQQQEGDRHQDI